MLLKLHRWISGTASSGRARNASSGNKRKHCVSSFDQIYLPSTFTTRSSRSLPRMWLRNGRDEKRFESGGRLRHADFDHSAVHDVFDALDCHRRFRDVRRQNHFARIGRRGSKHGQLLFGRQGCVEWINQKRFGVFREERKLFFQHFCQWFDFFLTGEKHENIASGKI